MFMLNFVFQICQQDIYEKDHHDLELLSFGGSWTEKFMSEEESVNLNSLTQEYEVDYASLQNLNHSHALTLKITMKRKIAEGVLQIIAPHGLFVVVSWAS